MTMDLLRPLRGGWAAAAEAAAAPALSPALASMDASAIRWRFDWEWAYDPENGVEGDTSWWWARSVRVDPNEVVADDGEGHLWCIPFSTDGTDTITWGDPQRVAEMFVPVAAAEGAMATAVVRRRRQRAVASFTDRPDKTHRPDRSNPATPTAVAATNEEERPMTDEQRRALALHFGLAEDATETAIHQAAAEQQPASPDDPPGSEEENEPDPEQAEQAGQEPEVPVAATEAMRTVRATLGLPSTATDQEVADRAAEIQRGAQAGSEARQAQLSAAMDAEVDAAVRDGRVAPSARQAWRAAIDPGTSGDAVAAERAQRERDTLAAMSTNRVPIAERGGTPDPDAADSTSLRRALAASGLTNRREQGEVTHRG